VALYSIFEITLANGETVEERGSARVYEGVLTITPPDRYGALRHFPLTSVLHWTSKDA
jgi:hypothetical protein